MHPNFSQLTPRWFKRAFVYTKDVQQQDFPWDDQGVEQLKAWLQERYDHYTREGSL